jgi:hypothetical protein
MNRMTIEVSEEAFTIGETSIRGSWSCPASSEIEPSSLPGTRRVKAFG